MYLETYRKSLRSGSRFPLSAGGASDGLAGAVLCAAGGLGSLAGVVGGGGLPAGGSIGDIGLLIGGPAGARPLIGGLAGAGLSIGGIGLLTGGIDLSAGGAGGALAAAGGGAMSMCRLWLISRTTGDCGVAPSRMLELGTEKVVILFSVVAVEVSTLGYICLNCGSWASGTDTCVWPPSCGVTLPPILGMLLEKAFAGTLVRC